MAPVPPKKKKAGFQYQPRDKASARKRAEQKGGGFDKPFGDTPMFSPGKGDHSIRILPPTWENAEHFGHDVHMNFGIGAENSSYLSLSKMKGEADPIAEELARATRAGEDEEYIRKLKPSRRVAYWVIDRKDEAAGPKLWAAPWTFDRDLMNQAMDKRTGEVLEVDHPEEGYDIDFTKEGEGLTTKYIGIKLARRPSPILDDEEDMAKVLEHITENPIPSTFHFFDYDYLKRTFEGGKAQAGDTDEDEDDKAPATRHKKKPVADDDDEDEAPAPKKGAKGKKAPVEDDDEDDAPPAKAKKKPAADDDDEDEDWDDEDDAPAKKPAKGKKAPVDDDEDDEPAPVAKGQKKAVVVDEDDADEDEDDEPAPKKPAKKVLVDDDEDDDEPPVKKPAKKKIVVDEDEDEDDEPAPKKSAAKGKKAPADDDDEWEDADDAPPAKPAKGKKAPADDDEDEDDEPAPKKSAAKGKKAPADDDEDEDEDEDDEEPAPKKPAKKPLRR